MDTISLNYDGFYRVGTSFILSDNQTLNLGASNRKHKGILVRPLTTNNRELIITFYGSTPSQEVILGIPGRTNALAVLQPYIIPCQLLRVSTPLIEVPEERFQITLLN
jgi:hypothetical protein